jgi:hypothetical protein
MGSKEWLEWNDSVHQDVSCVFDERDCFLAFMRRAKAKGGLVSIPFACPTMTSVKLYVYDLSQGMAKQMSLGLTGRQIGMCSMTLSSKV